MKSENIIILIGVVICCGMIGFNFTYSPAQEEVTELKEEGDARKYIYLVSFHIKTKKGDTGFGSSYMKVEKDINCIADVEAIKNNITGTNGWTVVIINLDYLGRE